MRLAWDSEAKAQAEEGYQRERSADPYHTYRWTRLSRAWRVSHPLCAECAKRGIVKAAQVTDHIVPWPVCGDFYDKSNLQSLCEECNHAKGQRDKKIIAEYRRTHTSM